MVATLLHVLCPRGQGSRKCPRFRVGISRLREDADSEVRTEPGPGLLSYLDLTPDSPCIPTTPIFAPHRSHWNRLLYQKKLGDSRKGLIPLIPKDPTQGPNQLHLESR